jgi:hypothetical protein
MFAAALTLLFAFQQVMPATAPKAKRVEAPKELIQAAEKGDVDKIRGLSQQQGFFGVDDKGRTALLAAGEEAQKPAFMAMLNIVNARAREQAGRVPKEGQDAVGGLMAAVRLRMSFFNAADDNGVTPLMHAARHGWDDVVRLLIDGGATVSNVDAEGRSAADYADQAGHPALGALLRAETK